MTLDAIPLEPRCPRRPEVFYAPDRECPLCAALRAARQQDATQRRGHPGYVVGRRAVEARREPSMFELVPPPGRDPAP